jgi:hypothetical protein
MGIAIAAAAWALLALAPGALALERVGQYGIGSIGAGSGEQIVPSGIAVSPDGTVVVSDLALSRVGIYTQSGQFLRAFGTDVSILQGGIGPEVCTNDCKNGGGGTGAGEFTSPFGVAATATEIYVPEIGNHRVSAFDYQGRFLRAFGKNVGGPGTDVCTAVCQAGSPGIEAGALAAPSTAALDPAGNLLVTELATNRVDVFNPQTGAFVRAFGKDVGGAGVNVCTTTCQIGVADGTPGSINTPWGITVTAAGEVFVTEDGAGRVSVFGPDGDFRRSFGSPGTGAGQLDGLGGVGVDLKGTVYVAENENDRLSIFGAGGNFLEARGFDVIPGAPAMPEICAAVCQKAGPGNGVGAFPEARGIGVDCRGALYVGILGRVEKLAEPETPAPPCPVAPPPTPAEKPSNAFTIGKKTKNKKKGTMTVEVTVPGAGSLVASAGRKIAAKAPQPTVAGTVRVLLKGAGKGLKALRRKGRLKGTLSLTFTPANGDPNTQSTQVRLAKKLKKPKKGKRGKAGKG